MTLRDAENELGLSDYQIYAALRRKEFKAIRPGGKGRIWYREIDLRALAARLSNPAFTFAGAA